MQGAGASHALANHVTATGGKWLYVVRDILGAEYTLDELQFFAPQLHSLLLPSDDVLPYDNFSPNNKIISDRIAALCALADNNADIVVVPAVALLQAYAPPSYLFARSFKLQVGGRLNREDFIAKLVAGGYQRVERVSESGSFAVYGGQIDFFPPTALPYRLVLFDDTIEQIRQFNPNDQRSIKQIEVIDIHPSTECDLSAEGITRFRQQFLETFDNNADSPIYRAVSDGRRPPGIEFYLPLFYEQTGRLFDYLNKQVTVVAQEGVEQELNNFISQVHRREEEARLYDSRLTLPVEKLYLSVADCWQQLQTQPFIQLPPPTAQTKLPPIGINHAAPNSHQALIDYIKQNDKKITICLDSVGRLESLKTALQKEGLLGDSIEHYQQTASHPLRFSLSTLRGGFALPTEAVLTENEIFNVVTMPKSRRQPLSPTLSAADEIQVCDKVIHPQHGIGISRGLKTITTQGRVEDVLEVQYAEEQRLLLPLNQLGQIEKYHGEEPVSKMGSRAWRSAYARAKKQAHDTATALLEIQAKRAMGTGIAHAPNKTTLAQFIDGFAYQETPDQQKVSEEILQDILQPKMMDRLISADVGFGKTEIAMRAAAAVVFAGGQVVVLAPTSLLAEQHFRTFSNRFVNFAVKIGRLTRLVPEAEKRQTIDAVAAGQLDILIGTHAVLQKRIKFKKLRLAIIDEEHRFGVRHKEHFKKMRANIDLLSLSATPIPRTLSMALSGLRDISIIATPPPRLSVKTKLATFSPAVIREACERELCRGGQIYFIHNDIHSLPAMAAQINQHLPNLRIQLAHGRMKPDDIELSIHRFLRREADVLLCTTIVESGMDITNANTIIINRADRLGLSRLHQLRGRVGRNNIQAYAYFLLPEEEAMTSDAQKRMMAIKEFSGLGSGAVLSLRDLEIRGAGEILGERQSGEVEKIGLANYQKLIKQATALLSGDATALNDGEMIDIQFSLPTLLPNDYVASPVERLHYYKKLNAADNDIAIDNIYATWQDRFGNLPPSAKLLIDAHRLRLMAAPLGIKRIKVEATGSATIYFCDNPPVASKIIDHITTGKCRPAGHNAIRLLITEEGDLKRCERIRQFLSQLQ